MDEGLPTLSSLLSYLLPVLFRRDLPVEVSGVVDDLELVEDVSTRQHIHCQNKTQPITGTTKKTQRDPRNNNHSKLLRPLGVRVAVDLKRQLARDVVVAVDVVVKTNVFRKDEKLWSVFSRPESRSMQKQKKTFAKFSNFCHFVTKDDVSNVDVDVKNAGFLWRLSSAKTIFLWINQTWSQLMFFFL